MDHGRNRARARSRALAAFALAGGAAGGPTLEETRITMDKWLETQGLVVKERNDWQQGKEVLAGRLELVKKELATLSESLQQAQARVAEADQKRTALEAENATLQAAAAQLAAAATALEARIAKLWKSLPEPLRQRLEPLHQRIPADPATTKVAVAERFQNVLGILNEINKSNHDLEVCYEVHPLAGGKPSEVRVLYVGLARAYYLSAGGEAGIGRPGPDGWVFEPVATIAEDVRTALDILQGKHTPAFVPLPVSH